MVKHITAQSPVHWSIVCADEIHQLLCAIPELHQLIQHRLQRTRHSLQHPAVQHGHGCRKCDWLRLFGPADLHDDAKHVPDHRSQKTEWNHTWGNNLQHEQSHNATIRFIFTVERQHDHRQLHDRLQQQSPNPECQLERVLPDPGQLIRIQASHSTGCPQLQLPNCVRLSGRAIKQLESHLRLQPMWLLHNQRLSKLQPGVQRNDLQLYHRVC